MGISKLLKKFDVKVIGKITKEQQIIISDNVATKISNRFAFIDYGYIYKKLMRAKMYVAIIPEGMTRAIYSYEEDTLFISDEEDLSTVSKGLLYECIHTMQDIRDKKGKVKQLGQCIFSEFKVYAMALNEASIQYIVSKIEDEEEKEVEAYGIKIKTFSPDKYPLICNILKQLLFMSNEELLIKSTIYSTDEFIIDCVEKLESEATFVSIQNNLDEMLYASEEIVGIKRKIRGLASDGYLEEIDKELNKIYEKEELIRKLYMDCQMTIFTVYFDKLYNRLQTLTDMKYYKTRLNKFEDLIGIYTDKEQDYFLEYYIDYCNKKTEKLTLREDEIKRKNDMALTIVSNNPIIQVFNKIKMSISKLWKKA